MQYSPENVAMMLAKLRLAGFEVPGYWMRSHEHDTLYMTFVPYNEMDEERQRANWKTFLEAVNHKLNGFK